MASINVLPKKLCFVNSGHISDSCNEVEKRINCGDGSISISWECSKILEEIETIIIKTDRGVSFPEAKKIFFFAFFFFASLPGSGYAAAAAAGSSKVVSPCESRFLDNCV